MERTDAQVGELLRQRREELDMRQDNLVYVSPSTVRKIEGGNILDVSAKSLTRHARALRWPANAHERLKAGDDPASLPHVPDRVYDTPEGDDAPVTRADLTALRDQVVALAEQVRSLALLVAGDSGERGAL